MRLLLYCIDGDVAAIELEKEDLGNALNGDYSSDIRRARRQDVHKVDCKEVHAGEEGGERAGSNSSQIRAQTLCSDSLLTMQEAAKPCPLKEHSNGQQRLGRES